MKQKVAFLIALMLMLTVSASAMEMLDAEEYTDVPSVIDRKSVV